MWKNNYSKALICMAFFFFWCSPDTAQHSKSWNNKYKIRSKTNPLAHKKKYGTISLPFDLFKCVCVIRCFLQCQGNVDIHFIHIIGHVEIIDKYNYQWRHGWYTHSRLWRTPLAYFWADPGSEVPLVAWGWITIGAFSPAGMKNIFLKTMTVSVLLFVSNCPKTEPFPLNIYLK